MTTADDAVRAPYVEAIIELEALKYEIKDLEDRELVLTTILKNGIDAKAIDEDDIKVGGLTPVTRRGGYDESVIGILKEKGLRDPIKTKETVDNKQVRELEESGQLTAEELEPYKKADSWSVSLPRGKKS